MFSFCVFIYLFYQGYFSLHFIWINIKSNLWSKQIRVSLTITSDVNWFDLDGDNEMSRSRTDKNIKKNYKNKNCSNANTLIK